MNKQLIKELLKLGGSICTGVTVNNIIKNNLVVDGIFSKVATCVGSALIGYVVCEKVEDYIDKEFDELDGLMTRIKSGQKKGDIQKAPEQEEE